MLLYRSVVSTEVSARGGLPGEKPDATQSQCGNIAGRYTPTSARLALQWRPVSRLARCGAHCRIGAFGDCFTPCHLCATVRSRVSRSCLRACWLSLRTCTLVRACRDCVFGLPGVLLVASRMVVTLRLEREPVNARRPSIRRCWASLCEDVSRFWAELYRLGHKYGMSAWG